MRQAGAGLCTVGVSFGAALPATVADCSGGSNRRSPRRSRFFHKSAAAKTESRSASISSEIAYYPFRTFFTLCRFGRTPPTGAELAAGLETDFSDRLSLCSAERGCSRAVCESLWTIMMKEGVCVKIGRLQRNFPTEKEIRAAALKTTAGFYFQILCHRRSKRLRVLAYADEERYRLDCGDYFTVCFSHGHIPYRKLRDRKSVV